MQERRRWRRAMTRERKRRKTHDFYVWLCDQQKLTGRDRELAMEFAKRNLLSLEKRQW